jgi:hypothetical protein
MNVLRCLRRLLGRQPLNLSSSDALVIVKRRFGRALFERVAIREQRGGFIVGTGLGRRPNGPRFIVDGYTGDVREIPGGPR